MSSSILVEERGSVFSVGVGVVMPTIMGFPAGDVMPAVEWIAAGFGMFPLNGWFVLFISDNQDVIVFLCSILAGVVCLL